MKKRLINESSVRKMMKLANIQALTENFLDETEELEETQDVTEESLGSQVFERHDDEMPPEELPSDDMSMDAEEPPMDDMPDEAPEELGDEPAGEPVTVDSDEFVQDLLSLLQKHNFAVSTDEGPPMDDMPMDDEEPPMDDVPMGDEEPLAEVAVDEENLEETDAAVDEDVVNEITRRVAERILQASSD
jgi:hypothetical protein